MARLVFFGTPEFAVPSLETLLSARHEIAAVYTQPDRPAGRGRALRPTPVKARAEGRGLPVRTPERPRDEVASLRALGAEVFVVAAYGKLLPASVLAIPPKGVVNVHPSLLPRWRGAAPVESAILAGDSVTGISIMLLDAGMDSGPILAQVEEAIHDDDTTGSLEARLATRGARLLGETLEGWLAGRISPRPQDPERVTLCRKIEAEEGALDWSKPAVELWRKVRAFQPWPGAFTSWNGQRLEIAEAHPAESTGQPTGSVTVRGKELLIAAGEGALRVAKLQPAGKRVMTAQEFLAGRVSIDGARLPS